MTEGPKDVLAHIHCMVPEVHGDRCRCKLELPEQRGADFPDVDMVNHPPHYSSHPSGIEAIEITRHLTFDIGNAVKYVMRAPFKGTEQQDLDKARWYLDDAIRHADRIFLSSRKFNVQQQLYLVEQAETDPQRVRFFRAIPPGNLAEALAAVMALLQQTESET